MHRKPSGKGEGNALVQGGIVMIELISYLARTIPGVVADTEVLEHLLAESWEQLDGSCDRRMEGYKILGRMEDVHWKPPILSFSIERHLVCGSNRAVLQHWSVNLDHNTATITRTEERILYPLSLRLTVETAAEEIAQAILGGKNDERVCWGEDGAACVAASWVFPKWSAFARTTGTRRRLLCNHIGDVLAHHGWKQCGRNRFMKKQQNALAERSSVRHAPGAKRYFKEEEQ
jgi:hypothetical protein